VRLGLRERKASVRLTPELLDLLSGAPTVRGLDGDTGWSQAALAGVALALRASGPGWRVRRWPEPRAWAAGVVLPDLLVRTEGQRWLVCSVHSSADAERLAAIARLDTTGEPLLFVGAAESLGPLEMVGAQLVALPSWEPSAAAAVLPEALVGSVGQRGAAA
jgi:hypothetical protein